MAPDDRNRTSDDPGSLADIPSESGILSGLRPLTDPPVVNYNEATTPWRPVSRRTPERPEGLSATLGDAGDRAAAASVRMAAASLGGDRPALLALPTALDDFRPDRGGPDARDWVAVIDIGSNSVRMVVFDGLARAAVPIFNEKILCGLGRGLGRDGSLDVTAMAMALRTIDRFAVLARGMAVNHIEAIATAAVRDAENGRHFAQEITRRSGIAVRVLSGADEARLSALGLLSGIPGARGVMGDLGGGSLELVTIDGDPGAAPDPGVVLHDHATLPIGPLWLMEDARGDVDRARDLVDRRLDGLSWLGRGMEDRLFYVVGGAWRSLARLHMRETDAPLAVVHQYASATEALIRLCGRVSRMSRADLQAAPWVKKSRAETLPFAAVTLERLLRRIRPAGVMFSAFGLREGVLYEGLPPEDRSRDPLLDQCTSMAFRDNRFGVLGRALAGFTAPLFPGETAAALRLRRAACMLSDIGWQLHPSGRAAVTFDNILLAPLSGIDHPGRAFIALAVYCGYGGRGNDDAVLPARRLLTAERQRSARVLGAAIRLGNEFAGRSSRLMGLARLRGLPERVDLAVSPQGRALVGDAVERRLAALAGQLGQLPCAVV